MLYWKGMNDLTAADLLTYIIAIVLSLTLHEMMHALTALKLGDTTAQEQGRISFNPLDHIDPFMTVILPIITIAVFGVPVLAAKPVPFNPERVKYDDYGAALVAAAGPLTNLALAILAAVLMRLFIDSSGVIHVLNIFLSLNIALFVFNLIPIPPLDGSRVLYAFAPEAVRDVMAQIEAFGIFLIFGLVLFVQPFTTLLINLNDAVYRFVLRL
jgi:Zn-dependent protease